MKSVWRGLRVVGTLLLFAVIALCLTVTVVPRFLDRIYYQGPDSAHFDGAHFFNPDEGQGESPIDPTKPARDSGARRGALSFLLRWITGNDERPPWPERVRVAQAKPRELMPLKAGEMRATWVGHATVLVETPGMNILTDPIWSDVAGPFGIGPTRVAKPGIAFKDLPRIDIVVVSHNHYDHLDTATLKRLWDRDRPMFAVSPGNDAILQKADIPLGVRDCGGCGVVRLDWGAKTVRVTDRDGVATVTVNRNHHWSSRWGVDRNRALWSSFVIDTPSGAVFFAGDTGPGDMRWPAEAKAAAAGPIRLAIIPIGAFRFTPGQMWSGSHIGPRQAVEVFEGAGAAYALPIHWGTFRLSWEEYWTPPRMLALEMACAALPQERFKGRPIGRSFMVPASPPPRLAVKPRCDRKAIAALH